MYFFQKYVMLVMNLLNDNEQDVCTNCRNNLPVTNFHFNNDDTVLKIFYGRVKVEHATALLRFEKKGMVQQLIHGLKYKGQEAIGVFLGNWLGGELKTVKAYDDIDVVIPVHFIKRNLKKEATTKLPNLPSTLQKP